MNFLNLLSLVIIHQNQARHDTWLGLCCDNLENPNQRRNFIDIHWKSKIGLSLSRRALKSSCPNTISLDHKPRQSGDSCDNHQNMGNTSNTSCVARATNLVPQSASFGCFVSLMASHPFEVPADWRVQVPWILDPLGQPTLSNGLR